MNEEKHSIGFCNKMIKYFASLEHWYMSRGNAINILKSVKRMIRIDEADENIRIAAMENKIARLEEIEQEASDLKSQLEEYWHQDYVKETDDALVEQMHREADIV